MVDSSFGGQNQRIETSLVHYWCSLSADSGLPTYRGVGGLYNQECDEEGLSIETLLSGPMLRSRPEVCWRYIYQIEEACRGAQPNVGHLFMAWLERQREDVVVLTQNVDGLHRVLGRSSSLKSTAVSIPFIVWNVIGKHESMTMLVCKSPALSEMRGLVRPGVVLFGERLPGVALSRLISELEKGFDLVVSVGTTSAFPYIAEPVRRSNWSGGFTVEINPGRSEVSDLVRLRIPISAALVFQTLGEEMGAAL